MVLFFLLFNIHTSNPQTHNKNVFKSSRPKPLVNSTPPATSKMCTQHYTQVKYDCGHKTVYKDDFEGCNKDNCSKVKDRYETDWISGDCPDCQKK